MATIALYANKAEQMSGLINNVRTSIADYKSELSVMKNKILNINPSICNMDDIIASIQSSSQTQERKDSSLETFNRNSEEFMADTVEIDSNVAETVRQRKEDFYKQYSYLKPEQNVVWDSIKNGFKSVGQFCKEYWKELVGTALIILGAVLAIAAVIVTGGMALVPLLTALLSAMGVSAGLAATVATVTSLFIAVTAILSTLGSSTLNIIDTWCNINNPTFSTWQKALNVISMLSNGLYSIGSVYNGFRGISNENLRVYGNEWRSNPEFRNAIIRSDNFHFSIKADSSTFWTGMRENSGEHVAKNYVERYGGNALENLMSESGVSRIPGIDDVANFDWKGASSALALGSSGKVKVLIGSTPRPDSVWNTLEKILININPNVTGIQEIFGVQTLLIQRVFEIKSLLSGIGSGCESLISLLKMLFKKEKD